MDTGTSTIEWITLVVAIAVGLALLSLGWQGSAATFGRRAAADPPER